MSGSGGGDSWYAVCGGVHKRGSLLLLERREVRWAVSLALCVAEGVVFGGCKRGSGRARVDC